MLWFKLEKILSQKKISIYRLSKITGISRQTFYALKDGKFDDLKFSTMKKIADALDISLDEFR